MEESLNKGVPGTHTERAAITAKPIFCFWIDFVQLIRVLLINIIIQITHRFIRTTTKEQRDKMAKTRVDLKAHSSRLVSISTSSYAWLHAFSLGFGQRFIH